LRPDLGVAGAGIRQDLHSFAGYRVEPGVDGWRVGQRIMITLVLSAGWTTTISIVSPNWLMAPLARGVVGRFGKADSSSV
jgi:hypothetical protein